MKETIEKGTGRHIVDYDFFDGKIKVPRKNKIADASKEMDKLLRALDKLLYSRPRKKKKEDTGRGRKTHQQLCMSKMFYGDSLENHLNFLRTYMPQENKKDITEKPTLFSEEEDYLPEYRIAEYERKAYKKFFKFILSPEDGSMDLKILARNFIKNLQNNTGQNYTWVAVEHHDTDHPHVHILINGIDKKTKRIINKIPSEHVKNARNVAGQICTQYLGGRSQSLIDASRKRMPYVQRYCKIDDEIQKYCQRFSVDVQADGKDYEAEIISRNQEMTERLNTLVKMGFARLMNPKKPPVYYLEKKWASIIKDIGRYNTYLDARNKMVFTRPGNLSLYNKNTGAVRGVVTMKYDMDDEYVFNNAIVVENAGEKKAYYIPLFKKADVNVGDVVELYTETGQNGKIKPVIKKIGETAIERKK